MISDMASDFLQYFFSLSLWLFILLFSTDDFSVKTDSPLKNRKMLAYNITMNIVVNNY